MGGRRGGLNPSRRRRLTPAFGVLLGVTLVLAGAGAVVISTAYGERPTAKRVGGNRPVNVGAGVPGDISAHNSPTVVRNPRNGSHLAVANRIDTPQFSCALHTSRDGGATWRQAAIPVPRGEEPKCYAPDVAYGADGTLYLSFVTLQGRGNVPSAAWLSRSVDGGRTLSRPVKLLGPLSFQVRLIADPETAGRLYITWLRVSEVGLYQFSETGNPIMFRRSDDGGRTWGSSTRVSAPSRQRAVAGSLAVGPGRELYVLYLDLAGDRLDYEGAHGGRGGDPYSGRWQLVLSRSTNGGETWSEALVEERLVPTERFIVFIPPFPSLAVDRGSGRLYAGFQDGQLGDADVWVWASGDGGASWKEPTRVNDTQPQDRTTQYLPKLAVAPNGRLDAVYYDRRRDGLDKQNEVSLQSSFDGGKSFTKRLTLSERPFDSQIGLGSERDLPDLGNRLGAVVTDTGTLAIWTDTRDGTEASNKQDIAEAVVAFSQPAQLSELLKHGLRYGGIALALAGGLAFLYASLRHRALRASAPSPATKQHPS